MRFHTKLVSAAAALVLATATAAPQAAAAPTHDAGIAATVTAVSTVPALFTLQNPPNVEVEIQTNEGGAWYTQPMWIAVGVIALVLIILLIVAAGRRDTTTVVK